MPQSSANLFITQHGDEVEREEETAGERRIVENTG